MAIQEASRRSTVAPYAQESPEDHLQQVSKRRAYKHGSALEIYRARVEASIRDSWTRANQR